ncbi:MAG: hypothetical protein O3C54_03965 [Proteobacteria bacterium]|uniref:Uncharacterized protein n=1 Tax=SAR86 cluster bacterium TaxID=2030880 RepID=A0A937I8J3_9GAMM|nr:hypothetical protein [SAR86 cluster bacterium]MBL6820126.1 hypothetical protein [SAR86 cluster bacterium]MDA0345098.1 hypothetical protein [Pseudomonadota bacterium]MDA0900263.1 hypothetical protein [Pseudomonadota bacterium]MDA1056225.1 hypothetical protein [Pseudomonadota bacterium]
MTFSILDILLGTGFILLFFRVQKNGLLKELVYLSFLLVFIFLVINNFAEVYNYFEDQGFNYGDDIYNLVLIILAFAGMPLLNFLASLYVPKFHGTFSMMSGVCIGFLRYMLLLFFVLQVYPSIFESSVVLNSFIVNIMLTFFFDIFVYLLY